jgi:2-dehydro-3-deoxyphosphogluconate aldolase/(4S)-4-hydroxy-2-oxoglutarate aldolase
MSDALSAWLSRTRVLPVLTVREPASAPDLARALTAGGLTVLEVTLRTPGALAAITAMRQAAPEAIIAAGTVLTPDDLKAAAGAGAHFAVSPGMTPALLDADRAIPWLPGAATASEVMLGLGAGLTLFKFFPAESAGGAAALAHFAGPFPHARFCPTGGLNPASIAGYLRLSNVICVGGSWMIDSQAVAAGRWADITAAARAAASL